MPPGNQPPGRLRQHLGHDRLGGRADERRVPGEHLVQHAAQGVDIRAPGDLPLAHGLFRAHVVRGAKTEAGLGHPSAAGGAQGERDTEVGHQRLPLVQQDVLRLDVAVDHALPVGIVERARHLRGDPDRHLDGELLVPPQTVAERLAFHVGHDVECGASDLPRVVQGEDVGMLEVGGGLDLLKEALGPDHRGELRAEHLECHFAMVLDVLGQVDGRHPARAELALEHVAVPECIGDLRRWCGHSYRGGGGAVNLRRSPARRQQGAFTLHLSRFTRLISGHAVADPHHHGRSRDRRPAERGAGGVRLLHRDVLLPRRRPGRGAPGESRPRDPDRRGARAARRRSSRRWPATPRSRPSRCWSRPTPSARSGSAGSASPRR